MFSLPVRDCVKLSFQGDGDGLHDAQMETLHECGLASLATTND